MTTRTLSSFYSFLALALSLTCAQGQEVPGRVSTPTGAQDVISEEALQKKAAKVSKLDEHFRSKTKPIVSEAPAVQSSLWARSIILSDGFRFTLIPVGSILHLPQELRRYVVAEPRGQFTFWPNFLKQNGSWIEAKEVSLELSRGDQKALKALVLSVAKHPRVLVAVYKGGPITILEPAPETQKEGKAKS